MKTVNWQGADQAMTAADKVENLNRVQSLIEERARREEFFPAELFTDPGWEILLQLYAAQMAQARVAITELAKKATVPETTTLRWLTVLDAAGYIVRKPDPLHKRRVFLILTCKGLDAMQRYLTGSSEDLDQSCQNVLGSELVAGSRKLPAINEGVVDTIRVSSLLHCLGVDAKPPH